MNIRDFTPKIYSYAEIFARQKELKFMFEPESKSIFAEFDIDTFEDQETFKKYCWRITEELMEALECIDDHIHLREELIDGLNFLMELYILCGVDINLLEFPPKNIMHSSKPLEDRILHVIYGLGMAANVLKNRQWRQSQYLVDMYVFEPRVMRLWAHYFQIFYCLGMNGKDIKALWSLKYQVNLFRIKSNY